MCLGIPGRVLAVTEQADAMLMGKVEFGGITKDICLAYVPDVAVGDFVLVHVGFAISKIDEQEAQEIFSYIEQIDELSGPSDPFDAGPATGSGEPEGQP